MRWEITRGGNVSGSAHCWAKSVMRPSRNRRLPERRNGRWLSHKAPALPPLLENEIQGRSGDFRGLAPGVGGSRIDNPWAVGRKNV